jgi:hypothetical protein
MLGNGGKAVFDTGDEQIGCGYLEPAVSKSSEF